jgi:hypothetical protein
VVERIRIAAPTVRHADTRAGVVAAQHVTFRIIDEFASDALLQPA